MSATFAARPVRAAGLACATISDRAYALSAGNQAAQTAAQDKPMLSELNPEKVCIIIVKMRNSTG